MIKHTESLRSLFYPRSIAIIGAHIDLTRLGSIILNTIIRFGYSGQLYPVNPKFASMDFSGHKFYASISDVPNDVDMAIILVGAKKVLEILNECVKKNVKSAIIFSSGFSEVSEDYGRTVEEEIRRISNESGMMVVGPNCLGVFSAPARVCTFPEAESRYEKTGRISAIFQSGSLLASFQIFSSFRGFYLNKGVSTGNEAATTLTDFLEYFIEDPETHVIAMYIEQVREGKRFIDLCKSTKKPLVALKVGRSEAGRMAAKSHTAALAGSIEVWDSVCRQVGIIQAKTFFQLYDYAMALASPKRPKGNRIGIITSPGGPSVIAADICGDLGLQIPRLSGESIEKLKKILPPFASLANPIDMTASALEDLNIYREIIEVAALDPCIDAILLITPLTEHLKIAKMIIDISDEIKKPIVVSWTSIMYGDELKEAMKMLGEKMIPNYFMPERAAEAISIMLHQSRIEQKKSFKE
ncbi:MAG: CoA-binding protein [Candidatus Bathyarchaeia archaeon]